MDTRRTPGPNLGTPLLTHLGRLSTDESALQEFRHWFSNALWALESGAEETSDDITDLFYAVENMLGVYDAGFWTADDLVATLREEAHKQMAMPSVPV